MRIQIRRQIYILMSIMVMALMKLNDIDVPQVILKVSFYYSYFSQ